jgi:hypothetical protein
MKRRNFLNSLAAKGATWGGALLAVLSGSGCSTMSSVFATDTASNPVNSAPIRNPFGEPSAQSKSETNPGVILRSKKGDRSVEVEFPKSNDDLNDFTIPMSPSFKDGGRSPASADGASPEANPDAYKDRAPSLSDREIVSTFPQGLPEDKVKRSEIESGLGLVQSEDGVPERDSSYLAALDHVKQLYRTARYENALLEVDDLIRIYQTDPKLYEMRGTLLDRLGKADLALKSWNQALRFNPGNEPLRHFVERKQQRRSLASP